MVGFTHKNGLEDVWILLLLQFLPTSNSSKCKNKDSAIYTVKECCPNYQMIEGTCKECKIGYYGLNCSRTCPPGYFGKQCKEKCSCENDQIECHHIHGCKIPTTQVESVTTQERTTESLPTETGTHAATEVIENTSYTDKNDLPSTFIYLLIVGSLLVFVIVIAAFVFRIKRWKTSNWQITKNLPRGIETNHVSSIARETSRNSSLISSGSKHEENNVCMFHANSGNSSHSQTVVYLTKYSIDSEDSDEDNEHISLVEGNP